MAWWIGGRTYPPDQFLAMYFTPDLLARLFAGKRPKPEINLAELKLPPEVRITSPATGSVFKQHSSTLTVEVEDLGGGVAEVQLYQHGKRVARRQGAQGGKSSYFFDVKLVSCENIPCENIFKAVALSHDRVGSNEDWVRVIYEAPVPAKPVLHLLVVGINEYEIQPSICAMPGRTPRPLPASLRSGAPVSSARSEPSSSLTRKRRKPTSSKLSTNWRNGHSPKTRCSST